MPPNPAHPEGSSLLGETFELIILYRSDRLHAKLTVLSIRRPMKKLKWNTETTLKSFTSYGSNACELEYTAWLHGQFYIYYWKTQLFDWVMSPSQCSVTQMNINKRLWGKKRADKQEAEECKAEKEKEKKSPQINHSLAGRCAAATHRLQDSQVTTGLAKQRTIPMSSVTSQSTDWVVGERCWKEYSSPPPIPYLCHKVFQSFNSNPPLTTQTVAALSLISISEPRVEEVNL